LLILNLYLVVLLNSLYFLYMLLRVSKPSSSWTWSDGSIIWIAESSRGIFPIYYVLIEILLYFIILIISYKFRNILRLYFELIIHILYIIIKIFSFNASIITILSILISFYFGRFILWITFSIKISGVILWTAIFFIHLRIIRGREVFNRCTRCDWTALVIIFSFVLIKKLINFPFYFVRFLQYSIFQIWRAVYILYLRAFITLKRWSFIFLKFLINLIIAFCILILLLIFAIIRMVLLIFIIINILFWLLFIFVLILLIFVTLAVLFLLFKILIIIKI